MNTEKNNAYRKRIADALLEEQLESAGAVLVEGPKWCGKTTTCKQIAASVLKMDDPNNLLVASLDLQHLLEGATPRLIDEWQLAPKIWDAVRNEVDNRGQVGQFMLTGSSVPTDKTDIHHSGTGRFNFLRLRPMSLYESGDSTGEVSLADLFQGKQDIFGHNPHSLEQIAYLACRGGWPFALTMKKERALDVAFGYYEGVVRSDINRADGVNKDENKVRSLMRSYARNQGTQAGLKVLQDDVNGSSTIDTVSDRTIASYITALESIFVIEDSLAWNPDLRSKSAIRSSPTHYYSDPSIAAASLGASPSDLMNDIRTFGFIFETMAIRDLRVYASALHGTVSHYRDNTDLECDAAIHLRNGSYGLCEIKLGSPEGIKEGSKSLLTLADRLDYTKMKKPSFLMVLTAVGSYAYRQENGVMVVPIGTLKN